MATLIVVRHGEAEGNGEHRLIGQSDMHLTELGRTQAARVAARLAGLGVTRVVSSDLVRALDTVRPLAEQVGLPVEEDARLREIDNGEWTGLLPREIGSRWPDLWSDYVVGRDVARPGGERWEDVAARVVTSVEELIAADGTVVVSTHGGPALIVAMWASGTLTGGNIFRRRLAALNNASVTIVDEGPRLAAFNDVGHLHAAAPDLRLPFEEV